MEISAVNRQHNIALKSQNDYYSNPMATSYSDSYSTDYPAYVDESSSSNSKAMLGLTALGVLGLAGTIFGVVKYKNCKKLAKDLAEKEKSLTETANKLADETKRRETAEEALRVANEKLENSKPKNNVKNAVKNNTNKTGFFKKIANWFKNLGNNKML